MPIGSEVKRPLFAKALAAVRGCTFLIRVLPVALLGSLFDGTKTDSCTRLSATTAIQALFDFDLDRR